MTPRTVRLQNFLWSLVDWITQQALALSPSTVLTQYGPPRDVGVNLIREADAADPYTVLRFYGGPPITWHPLIRFNAQVLTVGTDPLTSQERAWMVLQSLLDPSGKGLRMQRIPGLTPNPSDAPLTTTITTALAGSASMVVANGAALTVGSRYSIALDGTNPSENFTVQSVTGNTIAIGTPLAYNHVSGAFIETDGQYLITSLDALQRPGILSYDERGRANVVFNVEVSFYKAS